MSTGRTAFEQFWSQKLQTSISESRSGDMDRVREQKRRLRSDLGFSPGGFVAADSPIGVKQLWKQKQDLADLRALATAEGSAIPAGGSWVDFVTPRENFSENRQSLINAGARPPEAEREEQRARRAERAEQQATAAVRDFLMDICESVLDAGGDGVAALETAAADRVPDQPGIDGEQVRDSVQDIIDEFGTQTVENAIRQCRVEVEQREEQAGAPTATDPQGRVIRPVPEIVDEFASTVSTQGIDVGLNAVTGVELGEVADDAEQGDLAPDDRDAIVSALENADEDALGRAADESDALFDLLFQLDLRIPPPPPPEPDFGDDEPVVEEVGDEATQAATRVGDLLEPTPSRGLEHFERLVLALETQDPVEGLALGADTLDALTERDRNRFLEEARQQRDRLSAARLSLDDLPNVQRLVSTGASGKRRSNFWIPVRDELQANDEFPTLADPPGSIQGAPNEELNRLNLADDARQEALQEVERQIDRLEGRQEGGGQALDVDQQQDQGQSQAGGISLDDIVNAWAGRVADRLVPGREREDWLDNEQWTATPERVALERDFAAWAHQTKANNRWDSSDFQLRPENRDKSMQRWAQLQVSAGNSTIQTAVDAGLPQEWFQ